MFSTKSYYNIPISFINRLTVDRFRKLVLGMGVNILPIVEQKDTQQIALLDEFKVLYRIQKILRNQKNYIRNNKAQYYHYVLSQIYKEMRIIYEFGGI